MKQIDAIKRLHAFDMKGRYVYRYKDLKKVFYCHSDKAFESTVKRLVCSEILERVAKGVYVYGLSQHKATSSTLENIAKNLRRGKYNYISLESALSEYGLISQIPLDRLTIMTTGSSAEFKTPFGVLEFTHTSRSAINIIDNTLRREGVLRMATQDVALEDLKRVGRNLHMIQAIDWSDVK